jgi:hypothetical protein
MRRSAGITRQGSSRQWRMNSANIAASSSSSVQRSTRSCAGLGSMGRIARPTTAAHAVKMKSLRPMMASPPGVPLRPSLNQRRGVLGLEQALVDRHQAGFQDRLPSGDEGDVTCIDMRDLPLARAGAAEGSPGRTEAHDPALSMESSSAGTSVGSRLTIQSGGIKYTSPSPDTTR